MARSTLRPRLPLMTQQQRVTGTHPESGEPIDFHYTIQREERP